VWYLAVEAAKVAFLLEVDAVLFFARLRLESGDDQHIVLQGEADVLSEKKVLLD
jgi:hypothetical protein